MNYAIRNFWRGILDFSTNIEVFVAKKNVMNIRFEEYISGRIYKYHYNFVNTLISSYYYEKFRDTESLDKQETITVSHEVETLKINDSNVKLYYHKFHR